MRSSIKVNKHQSYSSRSLVEEGATSNFTCFRKDLSKEVEKGSLVISFVCMFLCVFVVKRREKAICLCINS